MSQYRFTKTHEIDKDKFAELVVAAQGNRSLRSFAAACGVYASTLTRIIQKANKGASSPELIESIAENADPKSGVTIELLANANGYSLINHPSHYPLPLNSISEGLITSIFVQELFNREVNVRMKKTDITDGLLIGKNSCIHYSLQIITDAFCGESQSWLLRFLTPYGFSIDSRKDCSQFKGQVYDIIGRVVLFSFSKAYSAFSPPPRFSIVISNRDAYNYIVDEIRDTVVPIDISIILVDTKNSVIVDEYMLPHVIHGYRPSYFMTTKPIINYQNPELYEDDFERRCDNEGNP